MIRNTTFSFVFRKLTKNKSNPFLYVSSTNILWYAVILFSPKFEFSKYFLEQNTFSWFKNQKSSRRYWNRCCGYKVYYSMPATESRCSCAGGLRISKQSSISEVPLPTAGVTLMCSSHGLPEVASGIKLQLLMVVTCFIIHHLLLPSLPCCPATLPRITS